MEKPSDIFFRFEHTPPPPPDEEVIDLLMDPEKLVSALPLEEQEEYRRAAESIVEARERAPEEIGDLNIG